MVYTANNIAAGNLWVEISDSILTFADIFIAAKL